MNKRDNRTSKIIVVLDPAARTSMVIEMIRLMITERLPQLLGILVEDSGLLEHARSSLALEVLHSGTSRPLESATLRRQIQAQSRQARVEFEAAAAKLGLPHSFELARGELLSELASRAAEAETLVIALPPDSIVVRKAWPNALEQLSHASARVILFAREGWHAGSSIVSIIDERDTADNILMLTARFAHQSHSPMSILLTGKSVEDSERIRDHLHNLTDLKLAAPITVSAAETVEHSLLTATVKHTHARIIILPWDYAMCDSQVVENLLKETKSAVLLVK